MEEVETVVEVEAKAVVSKVPEVEAKADCSADKSRHIANAGHSSNVLRSLCRCRYCKSFYH